MAASTIPAYLDALVAAAQAALASVRVVVSYGVPVSRDSGPWLVIGASDLASGGEAVTASQNPATFSGTTRTRDEFYDVNCIVSTWNGDGSASLAVHDAHDITAVIEATVRSNLTMGVPGVIYSGFGGVTSLVIDQTDQGAEVALGFTVSVRARI